MILVSPQDSSVMVRDAKFRIGEIVRHRVYPFRGLIFDVDPTFNNTDGMVRGYSRGG